jgi:hypothetical protein
VWANAGAVSSPAAGSATHNCRSAFGMHKATPGRHPVDLAWPDRHCGTEAVAMHDLAIE